MWQSHNPDTSSPPSARSLSLLMISRPTTPPPSPPPPPPHTAVSVPFKWEESPGKPRACHAQSEPEPEPKNKTLELPPRLLLMDGPSPTTVLGGPYVGRAVSFSSSYRTPRDNWASNFGSARFTGFSRKVAKEEDDYEGIFDFSSSHKKIASVPRRRSSLSLSHQSKATSHFWASIYESFKQMVPWKRRHEKHRKWASKFDTL